MKVAERSRHYHSSRGFNLLPFLYHKVGKLRVIEGEVIGERGQAIKEDLPPVKTDAKPSRSKNEKAKFKEGKTSEG